MRRASVAADEEVSAPPNRTSEGGTVYVGRTLEPTGPPDLIMEDLLEKFKLLEYEQNFCRRKKPYRKPLSASYFAFPQINSSEQFSYFCNLAVWVLGLAGVEVAPPKSVDDPNIFLAELIRNVRSLGFAQPTYHASKLTQGFGPEVCGLLDGLTQLVMEKLQVRLKRPVYPVEEGTGEEEIEDDPNHEAGTDAMEQVADADYEEEEAYMQGGMGAKEGNESSDVPDEKAIIASKIDPNAWKIELERVGPKLRITLAADSKDWRNHLEQTHAQNKIITDLWPDSRSQLDRLRGDLDGSLEKVNTREKFLNEQFDTLMSGYKVERESLMQLQERHNASAEVVSDRNSELHRILEQLEEIKGLMGERGSNINDNTPVVRIKAAIKKLGEEMHGMEVRLGVVSHTLLQLSIKDKHRMHTAAALSDDEYDM